jgi:hypothetical protein
MPLDLPLPADKKLTVIFRLESGCLGPDGSNHIDSFSSQAQKKFATIDSEFINWVIIPRHDKTLPEREYQINNKLISREMTEKYLKLFDRELNHFEQNIDEKIGQLINEYLGY